MPRCNSCNGVIAKTDDDCYVCGEPVPGRATWSLFKLWGKTKAAAPKRVAVKAAQRVTMTESGLSRN